MERGSLVWRVVGWLALALNIWGNLQLTGKGRAGWLVRLVVNFLWIAYSVDQQAWALLANHVAFVGINIWGWFRWDPTNARVVPTSQPEKENRRMRDQLFEMEKDFRSDPRVVQAVRRVLMH